MSYPPLIKERRTRKPARSLRLSLIICLLFVLGMDLQVATVYPAHRHHEQAQIAYTVSGTVYDDYNQNGVQDAREPGLNGVVVTAYNSANAVVTTATTATVSAILGRYTLNIPNGTGAVRIQFSNFGATSSSAQLTGYYPANHTGGTAIAFVSGAQASNTVNQGLAYPADYCQNNPNVATNCYVYGSYSDPANTTAHVVVRFPYNSSGDETANTGLALMPQVGTTWSLAYRNSSDTLFMASYLKRIMGFGPSGPGAIYLLNGANSASPTVNATPFVTLAAGANPRTGSTNYMIDGGAYDLVGKMSLGGMALSDDQSTLYVMNLSDKSFIALV